MNCNNLHNYKIYCFCRSDEEVQYLGTRTWGSDVVHNSRNPSPPIFTRKIHPLRILAHVALNEDNARVSSTYGLDDISDHEADNLEETKNKFIDKNDEEENKEDDTKIINNENEETESKKVEMKNMTNDNNDERKQKDETKKMDNDEENVKKCETENMTKIQVSDTTNENNENVSDTENMNSDEERENDEQDSDATTVDMNTTTYFNSLTPQMQEVLRDLQHRFGHEDQAQEHYVDFGKKNEVNPSENENEEVENENEENPSENEQEDENPSEEDENANVNDEETDSDDNDNVDIKVQYIIIKFWISFYH